MKMAKAKRIRQDDYVSRMIENPTIFDRIVDVIVVLLCILVAVCSFVPMWHVLMSSLSEGKLLLAHEGLVLWPLGQWTIEGYKHIFQNMSILSGYMNSIIYTVSSTALGFFLASVTGYALSVDSKMKRPVVLYLTVPMLFSAGLVPSYMVIRALGWVGTRWAMIIPGCTNAMFMIMMMNAFNQVPHEMYEAARIDGASHFKTFYKVMLPQAMNMGSVIILNSVVGQWNAWLNAKIYVPNQKDLWPLQLWINQITTENANFLRTANPDYSRFLIQYAVIIAASLPLIVTFPFFQDKLEHAVIGGGVKG